MTPTERLILYGIKHLIDRETFTPELRKEMDKDIWNKIVNLVAPKKLEEDCSEIPEENFSFVSKDDALSGEAEQ